MMLPLAMLAGLVLSGQEPAPQAEPATPLPDVQVTAPADQGVVTLECRVNHRGAMRDCVILSETPPGQGFGEAALDGARRARVSPGTLDEAASGAKVTFTMRFQLDDSEAP